MVEKTPPVRPFCLEYEDAQREIVASVNAIVSKHKIPFYLLENIITNLAHQVSKNAEIERAEARQTYRTQLDEYEKGKGEGDNG